MSDKSCETCAHYEDFRCFKFDGIVCNHEKTWRSWERRVTKNCLTCSYGGDDGFPHGCLERRSIKKNKAGSDSCKGNDYFAWGSDDNLPVEEDDGNPFNTQTGGTHYKKVAGCPDVAEWCTMQQVEFSEGNVIKYVFRHERKNGFEDIEKAYQYLRFIAWVKYGKKL